MRHVQLRPQPRPRRRAGALRRDHRLPASRLQPGPRQPPGRATGDGGLPAPARQLDGGRPALLRTADREDRGDHRRSAVRAGHRRRAAAPAAPARPRAPRGLLRRARRRRRRARGGRRRAARRLRGGHARGSGRRHRRRAAEGDRRARRPRRAGAPPRRLRPGIEVREAARGRRGSAPCRREVDRLHRAPRHCRLPRPPPGGIRVHRPRRTGTRRPGLAGAGDGGRALPAPRRRPIPRGHRRRRRGHQPPVLPAHGELRHPLEPGAARTAHGAHPPLWPTARRPRLQPRRGQHARGARAPGAARQARRHPPGAALRQGVRRRRTPLREPIAPRAHGRGADRRGRAPGRRARYEPAHREPRRCGRGHRGARVRPARRGGRAPRPPAGGHGARALPAAPARLRPTLRPEERLLAGAGDSGRSRRPLLPGGRPGGGARCTPARA